MLIVLALMAMAMVMVMVMVRVMRLASEISKKDDRRLKQEIEDRIQTEQIYCGLDVNVLLDNCQKFLSDPGLLVRFMCLVVCH